MEGRRALRARQKRVEEVPAPAINNKRSTSSSVQNAAKRTSPARKRSPVRNVTTIKEKNSLVRRSSRARNVGSKEKSNNEPDPIKVSILI